MEQAEATVVGQRLKQGDNFSGWSGVSSGRSWIGGLPVRPAIGSEQVLSRDFI